MQEQKNIIDCYEKTAKNYAVQFIDELSKKHFDRMLLKTFAAENLRNGRLIDLGCGPGQTTKFLYDCGITDIIGTDLSLAMVETAKGINPSINFETADMLSLKYSDKTYGSAIAFYAIVHFDYEQVKTAFNEIRRVLKDSGQFLFSFHAGKETIHLDEFLDQKINIDFYFFETGRIAELLVNTGFEIIDVIEREPYKDAEHPSRRAYIWVKRSK